MSSKPTDFNDQAGEQGSDVVSKQINADLEAITADRLSADDKPAQLSEGGKPNNDVATGSLEQDLPLDDAARGPDYDWQADPAVPQFERNQNGDPKSSVRNTELVLRHDEQWRGVLGFCQLSYRIIKRKVPPMPHSEAGEWCDEDAAALRVWMSHQYGFTPSHGDINDALIVVARSNRFHPVRDYLEPLVWDGKDRLATWLKVAFQSTDNDRYLELVGAKVLVGAVARVMQPGCKMDNVMILEGQQGKGKSTVIAALFGEWFSDSPLPIGDKEAYQLIQGKWCFELGELDSFNKAEVTALKQFFSQQIDRFRPSYGRYAQDFPRQTQFWGSTNQDAYLRDYTGNRRFWPVFCSVIDRSWVTKHRDQLWAEAVHLYKTRHETGFQWWVSQETEEDESDYAIVTEAQDARLQRDPWEDLLRPWLNGRATPYVQSAEILKDCIGIDGAHMQPAQMNRLGPIMKSLGWHSTRKRLPLGKNNEKIQVRVWESVNVDDLLAEVPL